jgi:hypothetical protein
MLARRRDPGYVGSDTHLGEHCSLVVLVVLSWALMTMPAFWVMPAMDDWVASAPIARFTVDLLLPDSVLWRPFQHLFRVVAFWFPYPGFVHATNALGHLIAVGLVSILARQCGGSRRSSLLGALAYAIAPAVGAAVWSVDSENHVWSSVCGLTSAVLLSKQCSDSWRSHAGWLTFAMLSVLWNEGGIAWFVTAPLVKAFAQINRCAHVESNEEAQILDKSPPNVKDVYACCGKELALGFFGVSAYFAARFFLLGAVALGTPGARYGIGFNPITLVKHAVMLIGVSLSTVDTLALLSSKPKLWLAIISFGMGLPFLLGVIKHAMKCWTIHQWLLAMLALASVVAPFALMGHVSEMYAQRPAALVAVLLIGASYGSDRPSLPPFPRWTALVIALLACAIVNSHKLLSMVQVGQESVAVGRNIAEIFGREPPAGICVVCEAPVEKMGYSVFQAPPGIAANCGLATRMQWGWERQVAFHIVSSLENCRAFDGPAIAIAVSGKVKRLW